MTKGVVATVGDRASGRIESERGTLARLDGVAHPVVGEARLEIPNPGTGISSGEHFDHQVELLARQLGVGRRPGEHVVELVGLPFLVGRAGDQGLGEDVERISKRPQGLDVTIPHGPGDDRRLQEVLCEGWKQRAPAGVADPVAGPSHPLQGGGDGRWRLDEHHLVEVADVDAHFQRVGGDDGLQLAVLQAGLDLRSDLAG